MFSPALFPPFAERGNIIYLNNIINKNEKVQFQCRSFNSASRGD